MNASTEFDQETHQQKEQHMQYRFNVFWPACHNGEFVSDLMLETDASIVINAMEDHFPGNKWTIQEEIGF